MQIIQVAPIDPTLYRRKRVVAYARVSSGKDEAEHSLSNQIDYYTRLLASRPDWIPGKIYIDEAISGTRDDRPAFQQLLADARSKQYDLLLTKSVTRLARNVLTLLSFVHELKDLGIDVYFEKEHLHSLSTDGELMLSLLATFAEEEARSASQNKRWQIQKGFASGLPTPARPLGYIFSRGHFEIVPEEAAVVRRIFELYLSGAGLVRIAHILNEESVLPAWGFWWPYHLYYILRNEKYKGDLLLQKTYRPDFRDKKTYKNHGQWRKFYVEDAHDPIISRSMFAKVQLEIETRKKRNDQLVQSRHEQCLHSLESQTDASPSLFRGLIRCKACGGHYVRKHPHNKPYWICSIYSNLGKARCSSSRLQESVLQEKTRLALNLPDSAELTPEYIARNIECIESLCNHTLRFILKNGKIKVFSWSHPSRNLSWTPEMRAHASLVRKNAHEARKRQ